MTNQKEIDELRTFAATHDVVVDRDRRELDMILAVAESITLRNTRPCEDEPE